MTLIFISSSLVWVNPGCPVGSLYDSHFQILHWQSVFNENLISTSTYGFTVPVWKSFSCCPEYPINCEDIVSLFLGQLDWDHPSLDCSPISVLGTVTIIILFDFIRTHCLNFPVHWLPGVQVILTVTQHHHGDIEYLSAGGYCRAGCYPVNWRSGLCHVSFFSGRRYCHKEVRRTMEFSPQFARFRIPVCQNCILTCSWIIICPLLLGEFYIIIHYS